MIKEVFNKNFLVRLKTGLLTVGLGDCICQRIEINYDNNKTFNKKRFLIQTSWGFISTPYVVTQLYFLEKIYKVICLKTLFMNLFYFQFISAPI